MRQSCIEAVMCFRLPDCIFDDLVLKCSTYTHKKKLKNQHLRKASEKSSKEGLYKLYHYGDFALLSVLKQAALNQYKRISLLFSF